MSGKKSSKRKKELLKELKELDERCSAIYPKGKYLPITTPEEIEEDYKKLTEIGGMITDFYKKIFIPKYSKYSGPFFEETDKMLEKISTFTPLFIRNRNYFGLMVLLTPGRFMDDGSKKLESLIQRLLDEL